MRIELCDICKKEEADEMYKVKYRKRGCYIERCWRADRWTRYEKIAICKDCAKMLRRQQNTEIRNEKLDLDKLIEIQQQNRRNRRNRRGDSESSS